MPKTFEANTILTAADLNYFLQDSGWLTNVFTFDNTANYTDNGTRVRKVGNRVTIDGFINRAAGASTLTGNHANLGVLTMNSGYRPSATANIGALNNSGGWMGLQIAASGVISHMATDNTLGFAAGHNARFYIEYFVD